MLCNHLVCNITYWNFHSFASVNTVKVLEWSLWTHTVWSHNSRCWLQKKKRNVGQGTVSESGPRTAQTCEAAPSGPRWMVPLRLALWNGTCRWLGSNDTIMWRTNTMNSIVQSDSDKHLVFEFINMMMVFCEDSTNPNLWIQFR